MTSGQLAPLGAQVVGSSFTRVRERIARGRLARNTVWMLLGNGSRLLLQAATFVVITRVLGAAGYGAFAGVLALVSLAAPFVSLGAGNILVKNTARDPAAFRRSYRVALWVTAISGAMLCGAAVLAARALLPPTVPGLLVVAVAVSDLLIAGFYDVSWKAYQAFHRLQRVAQLHLLLSALKLTAALGFAAFVPTVGGGAGEGAAASAAMVGAWGVLYALCTLLATGVAVAWTWREVYRAATEGPAPRFDPVEGFYFSTGLAAQNVYNEIDKTMLARTATLGATGIYAAAYRAVEMAYLPIRSLFYAAYADFFRSGAGGIRAALAFGRRLMPAGLAYAAAAAVGIAIAAPLLPLLSGAEYREAIAAARWLAPIPLLRAAHHFAADVLSGAGYQGRRTVAQLTVAAANVGLNLWLIPAYGWLGAAWASLASDGLLALVMWGTVWGALRRERGA